MVYTMINFGNYQPRTMLKCILRLVLIICIHPKMATSMQFSIIVFGFLFALPLVSTLGRQEADSTNESTAAQLLYRVIADLFGLQKEITKLSERIDGLEKSDAEMPMVGFSAQLINNVNSGSHHKRVVFDHVITNVGGGYDATTGVFTAPAAGLYSISAALAAQTAGQFFIKLNGKTVGYMFTTGKAGKWEGNSETVTLFLQSEDRVWIDGTGSHAGFAAYCGTIRCYHSSFTGVLVSSKPNDS